MLKLTLVLGERANIVKRGDNLQPSRTLWPEWSTVAAVSEVSMEYCTFWFRNINNGVSYPSPRSDRDGIALDTGIDDLFYHHNFCRGESLRRTHGLGQDSLFVSLGDPGLHDFHIYSANIEWAPTALLVRSDMACCSHDRCLWPFRWARLDARVCFKCC